jgi:SAM-dependent methyltransferase
MLKNALTPVAKLPLPALPSKRDLAIAKAKLSAWWQGAEFDPASVVVDADPAPEKDDAAEDLLFEGDDPSHSEPRLAALQRFWGEGRLSPGDSAAEALLPVRAGVPASGLLGVFGPGLVGPVSAMAVAHPGQIQTYDWRDIAVPGLLAGIKRGGLRSRVKAQLFDLETSALQADSLDGVVCLDAFSYCGHPARLAVQLAKALKPGCGAVIETYVGQPGPHLAAGFASAFLEPQIVAAETLTELLFEAGLRIESDDDITAEHLDLARAGMRRLAESLSDPPPLTALALREIAWEAETWRARKAMLSANVLARRLIHAVRR